MESWSRLSFRGVLRVLRASELRAHRPLAGGFGGLGVLDLGFGGVGCLLGLWI